MEKGKITVFTPTYNRERSISRVYESLKKQTYKNFEWLIIDDGSTDNTKEVVEKFKKENLIKIRYIYQKNQGKHIAINNAVNNTDSELFLIADSDDAFVSYALEVFIFEWKRIKEKDKYKGIIVRSFSASNFEVIGKDFPKYRIDANELDGLFKLKLKGEKWSIFKTEVLREFKFPDIPGIKFYPETIIWQKIARKYLTRYVNIPLRIYYKDQENALTNKNTTRYKENIYLWEHIINEVNDYFFYDIKLFIKSYVGLSRDGTLNGFSLKKIVSIPNKLYKKMILILLYPVGKILAKMRSIK